MRKQSKEFNKMLWMRNRGDHHFKLLTPQDSQGSNMLYPLTPGFTSSRKSAKPSDPPWPQERIRTHVLVPIPGPLGKHTGGARGCPPARPTQGRLPSFVTEVSQQLTGGKAHGTAPCCRDWPPQTPHPKRWNIPHKDSPPLARTNTNEKDLQGLCC